MKRLSVLVLTVVLLCLGACTALAAVENGFYYDVENGGAVVVSYGFDNDDPERTLVIPDTLGGYPVKAIGYNAFDGCDWLRSVTLPKSLEKISWYAFAGCFNLEEISIPDGVTVIGKHAFSDCENLEKVTLPDSLVQIDGHAFQGCYSLKEITIPASVERVTNFTFGGCFALEKIDIKGRDTKIYRWAFANLRSDQGFEDTVNTDEVIFTCWPGQEKYSRSYSPEMYAVTVGIKNIRFHEDEAPAPPTIEEIPKDVVETGHPVVIVPLLNNSKGEYKKTGDTYNPKKDGLVINRVPLIPEEGNTDSENSCSVAYDMVPCDAHGNELKFWEGDAYILFFYKDFVINGEVLTRETIEQYDFKIAHEYAEDKFEYFDIDDIIFEKQGFRVKIKSLSPFTATVTGIGETRKLPTFAPVVKNTADISEDIEEIGQPVVMIQNISESTAVYADGSAYDPTEDGLLIKRVPKEAEYGSNAGTIKYDLAPHDALHNELKSWKCEGFVFFYYKDFVVNGKPLSGEDVALYDFTVVHDAAEGTESFTKDDIIFEKDGFRVPIKSLSPFTATVALSGNGAADVPATGDSSMNLFALLALFVLSASAAVVVSRRRA